VPLTISDAILNEGLQLLGNIVSDSVALVAAA